MAPSTPPSDSAVAELRARYSAAGQSHVLSLWDKLSPEQQASFFAQLSDLPVDRVANLAADAAAISVQGAGDEGEGSVEPLPADACASLVDGVDEKTRTNWRREGLRRIAQGNVAVVLMAGGQGTRLGSSAPKGCYDVGLPSKASLFAVQAARIRRIATVAAGEHGGAGAPSIPWYVMTSGPTRAATEAFFRENDFFGLPEKDVIVFEQGVLPCISLEGGKMMLERADKVAVAPDGNGGVYAALQRSGAIADMRRRGISHVHAYCVDNCLVKVADPVFVGFAAERGFDVATKVVRKRSAAEPVGLIVSKNGKPAVIEYSEINESAAAALDPTPEDPSRLRLRAANIVNHLYSLDFLAASNEWGAKLPHHVARKKIPVLPEGSDAAGQPVAPAKPNGIKLEQFVFDCFPSVAPGKFGCLEVAREDEFSPLKNGPGAGEDEPATSRRDVLRQGRRWAEKAGATIEGEGDGVEIHPLISYDGENLEFLRGRTLKAGSLIDRAE